MTSPYKELLTDLAVANQALTGYLENVLAVHRGEGDPVSPEIEMALGSFLVDVGFRLNKHVFKTSVEKFGGTAHDATQGK